MPKMCQKCDNFKFCMTVDKEKIICDWNVIIHLCHKDTILWQKCYNTFLKIPQSLNFVTKMWCQLFKTDARKCDGFVMEMWGCVPFFWFWIWIWCFFLQISDWSKIECQNWMPQINDGLNGPSAMQNIAEI